MIQFQRLAMGRAADRSYLVLVGCFPMIGLPGDHSLHYDSASYFLISYLGYLVMLLSHFLT